MTERRHFLSAAVRRAAQAQVPWQTTLAAFAFLRLLTVLPVTPGGLGTIRNRIT